MVGCVQHLLQDKVGRLNVFMLGNLIWTTKKRERCIQKLLEITFVQKALHFQFDCHSQHADETIKYMYF